MPIHLVAGRKSDGAQELLLVDDQGRPLLTLPEGAASEPTLAEIRDLLGTPLAAIPELSQSGLAFRLVPTGITGADESVSVVLASGVDVNVVQRDSTTVDPAVDAKGLGVRIVPDGAIAEALLKLGGAVGIKSRAQGITIGLGVDVRPIDVPEDLPTPAPIITLMDGPCLLWNIEARFVDTGGGYYVQLHDAADAAPLSDATRKGRSYKLDASNPGVIVSWGDLVPLEFKNGAVLAMSSDPVLYVAAVKNIFAVGSARDVPQPT